MPANRVTPCDTCPYRRSTPVGIWHPDEYANLQAQAQREDGGEIFGCHLGVELPPSERPVCVGWLADQKRHGTPSIRLRLRLRSHPEEAAAYERLEEHNPTLYDSIEEMTLANADRSFPARAKKAQQLIRKLYRGRR